MEPSSGFSVRESLLCLLEETLHSHQGVYLTEGTSLLETLSTIDSELASRSYSGFNQTIAGHVHHATYYLQNTLDMLRGKGDGSFDVAASWKIQTVATPDWELLKSDLAKTYQSVMALVSTAAESDLARALPALLGLFAHSAYHLGAIRQLKDLV